MPGVSSCVQLCGGTGTPPHYTWTTASNNHDNNITIISDYLQSPAGHFYGSVSMITKNNKIEKRKVKSFSKQTTPEVVSSTAASHQGVPAAPPHHERSKVVEDVSQSDEDGGVALQPPEGAVLLQQPVILGWGVGGGGETGETVGEAGGDITAASGAHLEVDGGGEDVLDEAQQLVGLQQLSGGRVLQGEVPFHWVREGGGVKEQSASEEESVEREKRSRRSSRRRRREKKQRRRRRPSSAADWPAGCGRAVVRLRPAAAGGGYLRGLLPKLKATDSLKDKLMAGK